MDYLIPVTRPSDIHPKFHGTPIADLLAYHNFNQAHESYNTAPLVVGMCMDHRERLRIPTNFAYILRAPGANFRASDFHLSYAIAVGGVSAIAIIGHTQCGMVNLMSRRETFIGGLIERAGWQPEWAQAHFMHYAPMYEIGHEVDFVISEANRLSMRYPKIPVAPLIYQVEDHLLYQVNESFSIIQPRPATVAISALPV
jgi:carbonic anhydrase